MKPIDNIKYVLPFLVFEDRNDFYYLQILQRYNIFNLSLRNMKYYS